jgi:hypothetical protein
MITKFNKKKSMEVKLPVFILVRKTLHFAVALEMPYSLLLVTESFHSTSRYMTKPQKFNPPTLSFQI